MRKSKVIIPLIVFGFLGVVVILNVFYFSSNQYNYTLAAEWGGFGYADEDGKFNLPYGSTMYTDKAGEEFLLISDCNNNNIQKFDLNGTFISKFGEGGTDPGSLDTPADVAVDKAGNIWVVEERNSRISKFDKNGNFLENFIITLEIEEEGKQVRTFNFLSEPLGIVFDSTNNLYTTNYTDNLVMKFDSERRFVDLLNKYEGDSNIFQFVSLMEEAFQEGKDYFSCDSGVVAPCTGEAEFKSPYYLAVDSKDNVYVVDRSNHRIQKFSPNGDFLLMWGRNGGDGTLGSGKGEFYFPHEIAIDKNDNVYIADTGNSRVQVFNSDGDFLFQLGDKSVFKTIKVVAVDSDLNIYVGDSGGDLGIDGESIEHEHRAHHDSSEHNVRITKWKKSLF